MTGPGPAVRLSAAEIAAELARTRSRLSHSLATLDREYALRHLFVHGLRMAHEGKPDAGSLAQGVHKNIVPVALIVAGLGWVALAGRGGAATLLDRLADGIALVKGLIQQSRQQRPQGASVESGNQRATTDAAGTAALPDQ